MKKEQDLLEETLALAEGGYAGAYRFLLGEYEKEPWLCGPQTLYFLACLAGGAQLPEEALKWLTVAIREKGWWYRPEVLEDDDLASLFQNAQFRSLKSLSDARYAQAAATGKAVFTWERKTADKLFLAVHGNTQNGQMAREDWVPVLDGRWQLETVQSGEPDGYKTWRWRYDMASYAPVAKGMEQVGKAGYKTLACGGFSAGCDMLLRAVLFTPARCDLLILQSPWLPILEDHGEDVTKALREKNITLKILCGEWDGDCLPLAKRLYELARGAGVSAKLVVQAESRHQFPKKPFSLDELCSAVDSLP